MRVRVGTRRVGGREARAGTSTARSTTTRREVRAGSRGGRGVVLVLRVLTRLPCGGWMSRQLPPEQSRRRDLREPTTDRHRRHDDTAITKPERHLLRGDLFGLPLSEELGELAVEEAVIEREGRLRWHVVHFARHFGGCQRCDLPFPHHPQPIVDNGHYVCHIVRGSDSGPSGVERVRRCGWPTTTSE